MLHVVFRREGAGHEDFSTGPALVRCIQESGDIFYTDVFETQCSSAASRRALEWRIHATVEGDNENRDQMKNNNGNGGRKRTRRQEKEAEQGEHW